MIFYLVCASKMDMILQAENPWILTDPRNLEDLKIPKCSDQFIRLLEAIKDRYYYLIQPGHQLQFLNLQLELIDSFRRRLVQLHSSGAVDSINILNAINYVTSVLREWGENIVSISLLALHSVSLINLLTFKHYLHLHAALLGPNPSEINTVFEDSVNELEHWQQRLIQNVSSKVVSEIKAKSMAYRHDNWATLPEQNSKEPFILSASAGEMFQVK